MEARCQAFVRKTKTPNGLADIELRVLKVRCRCMTEVDSRRRIVKTWKAVKPYETASRSHSTEQNI